jgi:hypothetical protein
VPRMNSRRPENAHSRFGCCAAIGSLTARAGFLPKPRLHSFQNLCASSLSSRLQVAHLTMAALHRTNLSSPLAREPPPSSSATTRPSGLDLRPVTLCPGHFPSKGTVARVHPSCLGDLFGELHHPRLKPEDFVETVSNLAEVAEPFAPALST